MGVSMNNISGKNLRKIYKNSYRELSILMLFSSLDIQKIEKKNQYFLYLDITKKKFPLNKDMEVLDFG